MRKGMFTQKTVAALCIVCVACTGAGAGLYYLLDEDNNNTAFEMGELQIFGNANGDSRIDNDDYVLLQKIVNGEVTEENREEEIGSRAYADANCDGSIDQRDVEQVRKIISGTAEFIWIVDGAGAVKKIKYNPDRIGCEYYSNTELMLILGLKDKIKAVDAAPYFFKDFYFGETHLRTNSMHNMGNMSDPDMETLLNTLPNHIDILFTFTAGSAASKALLEGAGVGVVFLGMYTPNLAVDEPLNSVYYQAVLKAGYIFGPDAVSRAEAYLTWTWNQKERIENVTSGISEEERPRVFVASYNQPFIENGSVGGNITAYMPADPIGQACVIAGGFFPSVNMAGTVNINGQPKVVSLETVFSSGNFDFLFIHTVWVTYGGVDNNNGNDSLMGKHGFGWTDTASMEAYYDAVRSRMTGNGDEYRMDLNLNKCDTYIIAGDFRNGASGCILLAAYMAKIFHPDKFEDLDPWALQKEFVNNWLGITDYAGNGVLIYPGLG